MASEPSGPAPVVVKLPPALLKLFPGAAAEVALQAASVAEVIAALDARWPGMRDRLCDSTPRLRRHINVFVGGKRVGLETPLAPGTEVVIMPGVIG